jgi:hypothetical protein
VLVRLLNAVKSKHLAEGLKKQDAADEKKVLPIISQGQKIM